MTAASSAPQISCPVELAVLRARVAALEAPNEPVEIQQRGSGGCWRPLDGLADFAAVRSYLSTAAKWGIDALDALTRLFTDGPGYLRPSAPAE